MSLCEAVEHPRRVAHRGPYRTLRHEHGAELFVPLTNLRNLVATRKIEMRPRCRAAVILSEALKEHPQRQRLGLGKHRKLGTFALVEVPARKRSPEGDLFVEPRCRNVDRDLVEPVWRPDIDGGWAVCLAVMANEAERESGGRGHHDVPEVNIDGRPEFFCPAACFGDRLDMEVEVDAWPSDRSLGSQVCAATLGNQGHELTVVASWGRQMRTGHRCPEVSSRVEAVCREVYEGRHPANIHDSTVVAPSSAWR